MSDDFMGSVAQEDVIFDTVVTQSVSVGDNFSKLMIFIERERFVKDPTAFINVAPGVDRAIVTRDSYSSVVDGVLLQWLTDFFASGATVEVYLVAFCDQLTSAADYDQTLLEAAYQKEKINAYFKTILVKGIDSDVILPAACVGLAQLCAPDKLYSSKPLYPIVSAPADLATDPIYAALEAADLDYSGCMHPAVTRNGWLAQLGLSLFVINGSGTAVGNSCDFAEMNVIDSSGVDGSALSVTEQQILKDANIAYFKPVGDGTGNVIMYGALTVKGDVVPAKWIEAYCDFLNKVYTAKIIVKMNTFVNKTTYNSILSRMSSTITKFTESGSGRLTNYSVTAPAYNSLPESARDEIIIPNAWSATYQDNVRKVQVQGTLSI